MKEPPGFASWNGALRGAYCKGYDAGAAGLGVEACPYHDKRKQSGRVTWSRAFRSCWLEGWNAARQDDPITGYYSDRARPGGY